MQNLVSLHVMKRLEQYLKDNFGVLQGVLGKAKSPDIPLYLKSNYEFYDGLIQGSKIMWVEVKQDVDVTPDQLHKQQQQLKQYLQMPIVFIFDRLESWMRRRLIEKKIAFGEPERQLYIPDLLFQLNDTNRTKTSYEIPSEKLTPPAQCLLLYHLQVQSLENRPFKEISEQLGYSAMSITRAAKELVRFEFAVVEGTREKEMEFTDKGRGLWERCLPRLSTPVREEWFSHVEPRANELFYAGESALSAYTMLAEGSIRSFAIGKELFRKEFLRGSLSPLGKNLERYRIEVWHYNPALLTKTHEVDMLSLYLSIRELDDERVHGALEDLIMKVKWL